MYMMCQNRVVNGMTGTMVLLPKSPGVFVGINFNERDAIRGAHMS